MNSGSVEIEKFISALSSSSPAPGGGGASALIAAVGCALCRMVGALTEGKKKYEAYGQDIKRLNTRMEELTEKLLRLIDEDERAFLPLAGTYSMPKDTPEQTETRERAMEKALKSAAEVPAELLRVCCEASEMLSEYAEKGSRLAISDVACGAAAISSGASGAMLNILRNTKMMKDRAYAEEINGKAEALLKKCTDNADAVYESVKKQLGGVSNAD